MINTFEFKKIKIRLFEILATLQSGRSTAGKHSVPLVNHNSPAGTAHLEKHLSYWVRYISNDVSASFERCLAQHDVTVAEWLALRILWRHAPCTLTWLADEMRTNKSAVSRLVDRLEVHRMVIKKNVAGDKRAVELMLTEKSKKLLLELAQAADENDAHFFGHIPREKQEEMISLLKTVAEKRTKTNQ